jgi:acetyltransferase
MNSHYLDRLFSPRGIAVFGASEALNSVGRRVFENLLHGDFRGPVYAINPKHNSVLSQPCFARIADTPKAIDLAVIATPAVTVPDILRQCGEHGVSAAIIISAGFSEGQGLGSDLEKELLQVAEQYQLQLLGPNCLGLIRPAISMNATFSKSSAMPGQLALISQSGALCAAILDWACANNVGFSTIISLGNAADLDFGDLLDFLAQDPKTQSILLYVEGIRDARGFMSGLRIASRMKPVVVIKAGRHQAASDAAVTHTGAMIGSDDVFSAALKRAGVIRADNIQQLFAAAEILASHRRVDGRRLAIVTNGGGLGVMATDRAGDLDIELATLSADTLASLNETLPSQWSQRNPVDLLGDAAPERYFHAVSACIADQNVDGVLAMLSPQAMTDPDACAQAVIDAQKGQNKPVLACWMGQDLIAGSHKLFAQHHLPSFSNPESSAEAFACLVRFHDNQQLLMQVPGPLATQSEPDVEGARRLIDRVLSEGRQVLSSTESRSLLKAFNIPVSVSIKCDSAKSALAAAESLGYPVVMKISSPSIIHKADVGGVRLNISNAQAVRTAYNELLEQVHVNLGNPYATHVTIEPMYVTPSGRELLVAASRDPVFGTAIVFGAGGIKVEVLQDRAIALPPLNQFLAERLVSETKISGLLGEFHGLPPINRQALIDVLLRVSEMVCELPELISLDINPLIADEKGVMALDASFEVAHCPADMNRYAHLAIHPYPQQFVTYEQLTDGSEITIRPIRPEDALIEQAFFRKLSAQSRYFRFMQRLNELTHDMLIRFTQLDYSRELALIAVTEIDGEEVEVGVARYITNPDAKSCEFALVVADEWQQRGIGSRLMKALLNSARQQGFTTMEGEILTSNINMQRLTESLGFTLSKDPNDPSIRLASKTLVSE